MYVCVQRSELGLGNVHVAGAEHSVDMSRLCSILQFSPTEESFLRNNPFPITMLSLPTDGYFQIQLKQNDTQTNNNQSQTQPQQLSTTLSSSQLPYGQSNTTQPYMSYMPDISYLPIEQQNMLMQQQLMHNPMLQNVLAMQQQQQQQSQSTAPVVVPLSHHSSQVQSPALHPNQNGKMKRSSSKLSKNISSASDNNIDNATASTSVSPQESPGEPASKLVKSLGKRKSQHNSADTLVDGGVSSSDYSDTDDVVEAVDDNDDDAKKALKKTYKQRYQQKKSIKRKLSRFHTSTGDSVMCVFVTKNSQRKHGCDIEFFNPSNDPQCFFNKFWAEQQNVVHSYVQRTTTTQPIINNNNNNNLLPNTQQSHLLHTGHLPYIPYNYQPMIHQSVYLDPRSNTLQQLAMPMQQQQIQSMHNSDSINKQD